jgi:rRNA processing protein Krr1/Pno1
MRRIYFYVPEQYMGRFIGSDGRMIRWTERTLECEFKIHGGTQLWFIIIGENHKAAFAAKFVHQMVKTEQFGLGRATELLTTMLREERP